MPRSSRHHGPGAGTGVGSGVGDGVGSGVGTGVGSGVDSGTGAAVGAGDGASGEVDFVQADIAESINMHNRIINDFFNTGTFFHCIYYIKVERKNKHCKKAGFNI